VKDNQMLYDFYKLNLRSKEELSQFSRELENREKNLYKPVEKLHERIEKTLKNPVSSNMYYYFKHDELKNNRFEREKLSVFSDIGTNQKLKDPKI
jgi:predicted  nucleic acid-binding Zn ribbon protein